MGQIKTYVQPQMIFFFALLLLSFPVTYQDSIGAGQTQKRLGDTLTSFNYDFNDIDIFFHNIFDGHRSVRSNIVQVVIHGHSLIDEAAFFELYYNGVIDSRRGLNQYLSTLIPDFEGLSNEEFDQIMSKWLYLLLMSF